MKWTLYRPFAPSKAGESWQCGACKDADGAVVFCGTEKSKELHDATVHGLTLVFEVQTGRHSNTYKPRYRSKCGPQCITHKRGCTTAQSTPTPTLDSRSG